MYIIKMLNLETTTIWKIITLSHLFKRNEEKINLNILSSGLQAEFKMPRRTSFRGTQRQFRKVSVRKAI